MRCTKEQFDAIRPKLEETGLRIILPTFITPPRYLTNFFNGEGNVTDLSKKEALEETDNLFEEWNEQTFLEHCGIGSFVLPEKWCVEITDENREVLLSWARKQPNYIRAYEIHFRSGNTLLSKHPVDNSYLYVDKPSVFLKEERQYKQITFEQFQQYVLKQEPIKQMKKYKNYTVPATDVLKIRAIACRTWKDNLTGYLREMDDNNNVTFSEEQIDAMFNAATDTQRPVLVEIFGEPAKAIEWDRIKTGSKVMIEYTGQSCGNLFEGIDFSQPVDVVFLKTPHRICPDGRFFSSGVHPSYCTFHQKGKYVLFAAHKNVDYITEVIEY